MLAWFWVGWGDGLRPTLGHRAMALSLVAVNLFKSRGGTLHAVFLQEKEPFVS
jgi:hypothetical protein